MKRSDKIKLNFTRGWPLPGKERLANWLKLSPAGQSSLANGIIWLKDENIALYSSADNFIESAILKTGTYESEIGKLIAVLLKDGDVALDVGANVGLQSLRMALRVGNTGNIYAFEPLAYLRKKLENNLSLNRANNVFVIPFALSDKESVTEYAVNTQSWNQGTFSLLDNNNEGTIEKVEIKVGDNLPEIKNLPKLNFIKIDVEGFELPVILGLRETITKHRPAVIFEYDENYWRKCGNDIHHCYEFFTNLNYKLYQIQEANAEAITAASLIASGNILCLPHLTHNEKR